MSTILAFEQRIAYDNDLPVDFFNQNFIDFNSQNRYGVVDTKNNLILPRFDKMKPFKDSKGKEVLSFVSRAYEEFGKDLIKQIEAGNWEKGSIFRTIQPAQAFVSPIDAFNEFMTKQFRQLMPTKKKSQKQLVSIYNNRNIVDFKSFVRVFEQYVVSVNYNFPYTLTGFLERHNNLAFSGLQIEFVKKDKNNFDKKLEYIEDPAFNRYLLLAEKHGFFVNRNMPWTLIANIDSPPMQKYASIDAGITIGTKGILSRYFQPATDLSFEFFTKYLVGSYNSVASSEPTMSYLEFSNDMCSGYKRVIINRQMVGDPAATPSQTMKDFDAVIEKSSKLLQLLYLTIRYYESFLDRKKYKVVLRRYYATQKLKKHSFSELVERLVSPAKNSKMLFYQITGATQPASFEFSFQAAQAAAKLGSSGAHQMPNGRWMPCASHEEYISLTSA